MTNNQQASIKKAADLLMRLTKPKQTPRVPKPIRDEAEGILKHFPMKCEDLSCCKEVQTPRPTKARIFSRMFSFFRN